MRMHWSLSWSRRDLYASSDRAKLQGRREQKFLGFSLLVCVYQM
jgi:hypothetical protein